MYTTQLSYDKEHIMDLQIYDEKHIRVTDIYGETHTGVAEYYNSDHCLHEYGENEEGIKVEDFLIYKPQIASIEEVEVHGTAELRTDRLVLRRYRPEDAAALYRHLGSDPAMYRYSGWNPYASLEMAQETVNRFIESYEDEHSYSWVIDVDGVLFGTIGAYDYENDRIEVGFSIIRAGWGQGYATEALKKVLEYLTENEGIACVTAWCAAENIGSRRVLEKSGMKLVSAAEDDLVVGEKRYERLFFEYKFEFITET